MKTYKGQTKSGRTVQIEVSDTRVTLLDAEGRGIMTLTDDQARQTREMAERLGGWQQLIEANA